MIYASDSLDITIALGSEPKRLIFTFKGHLDAESSKAGAEIWTDEFKKNSNQSYVMDWDCSEMTGFDIGARTEWYRCMKEYKSRILEVRVVSEHLIVRGAAKVMLALFGIKSTVVRALGELV